MIIRYPVLAQHFYCNSNERISCEILTSYSLDLVSTCSVKSRGVGIFSLRRWARAEQYEVVVEKSHTFDNNKVSELGGGMRCMGGVADGPHNYNWL